MFDPLKTALDSLPHGAEFRFIDHLLALSPGISAAAEYSVRGDEPFLAGHFPGEPIFPGVLLVEAGAQLAGIVAQSELGRKAAAPLRLTALRAVKILGTARPGQTIRLEARLLHRMEHLIQAEARAYVNTFLIMQAELTLSAAPTPGNSQEPGLSTRRP